MTYFNKFSYN